jgi:nucleoid DNA-binding protein
LKDLDKKIISKTDISDEVYVRHSAVLGSRTAAERIVKTVFDTIAEALQRGATRVQINNFGNFRLVRLAEKNMPMTFGKKANIVVPARDIIRFSMSRSLKEEINDGGEK